jgi:hypothetical protein
MSRRGREMRLLGGGDIHTVPQSPRKKLFGWDRLYLLHKMRQNTPYVY